MISRVLSCAGLRTGAVRESLAHYDVDVRDLDLQAV